MGTYAYIWPLNIKRQVIDSDCHLLLFLVCSAVNQLINQSINQYLY